MAKDRFDIKESESMGFSNHAKVIIDKETGVNYLFFHLGHAGGLTPLLDKEGNPIVTRVEGYQK